MKLFRYISLCILLLFGGVGYSQDQIISVGSDLLKSGNSLIALSYDVDAQVFFNTIDARGGNLTGIEKKAINNYVISLKSDNVWDLIHADYPMVGGTVISCAVNLKNPGTFDITFVNTVSGDFTSNGWTPNGTTSYAKTGIIPITHLQLNSTAVEYYSRTTVVDDNAFDMGAQASANQLIRFAIDFSVAGGTSISVYSTSQVVSFDTDNSKGGFMGSRIAINDIQLYRNGISLATVTSNNTGIRPDIEMYIGALNIAGSPGTFSTKECAGSAIFDGLTVAQVLSQYNARQNMNTTLSREVN